MIKEYSKELFNTYKKGAHFTSNTLYISASDVMDQQKESLINLCKKLKDITDYQDILDYTIYNLENHYVDYSTKAIEIYCLINGEKDMEEILKFELSYKNMCKKYNYNRKRANDTFIAKVKKSIIDNSKLFIRY